MTERGRPEAGLQRGLKNKAVSSNLFCLINTAARPVVTSSSFDLNLRSLVKHGLAYAQAPSEDEEIYDKDRAGSTLLIRKRGTNLGTDALLTKVSLE